MWLRDDRWGGGNGGGCGVNFQSTGKIQRREITEDIAGVLAIIKGEGDGLTGVSFLVCVKKH